MLLDEYTFTSETLVLYVCTDNTRVYIMKSYICIIPFYQMINLIELFKG